MKRKHDHLTSRIRQFYGLFKLVICLAFLSPTTGRGQNIPRPNIVSPSGLQVNSYTGGLYHKRADFFIPVQGLPIDISFSYSSAMRTTDQGFGYGWTFSYNQSYDVDSSGGVTINRGDGRKDYYAIVGNTYKQPVGIFDVLAQYEPDKYKLTAKDGTQYYFGDPVNKKLTRILDRNGNKILLTYSSGNIASVSDSLGHIVSFTWANNKVTEITAGVAANIRRIHYQYNAQGYLVQVKKPLGITISYAYGTNKGLSQYTDANGNTTDIIYNNNNAVIKLLSCQLEQRITYNPDQRKTYVTEVDNGNTRATAYEFDTKGRLINRTGNCCGYNTSFEYDSYNNITKIIDGNGGTKIYTYDNKGNPLAETDQLNHTSYFTYTGNFNLIASETDKKGNQTTYDYSTLGNLLSATDAFGHALSYTYDSHGNRVTKTDKKGFLTKYGYDQYGYLNLKIGPGGDTTTLINDIRGNMLSKTNARHATTNYSYDSLDRLTAVTDALQHATHFTYDANGNRLSITDPRGKATSFTYNSQDKIIKIVDPLNHVTVMDNDGMGNLIAKTDANGHITLYAYDNLSRLLSVTNAAGETTSYQYDGVGNKTSITKPNGNTALLKYDAANRVTEISDAQGIVAKYTYDANNNKLTEQDGKGNTVTYQYDALDRLLATTDPNGNAWHYVYDYNSNLIQETDRKGNSSNYTYDSLDRRTSYTDALNHTTSYSFDKVGNLSSVTDANNNTTQYTYDAVDQLIQEHFADNTTKSYSYDSSSNLTTRTDNAGQTTSFTYDDAGRPVLRSYSPSLADTFAYDNIGLLIIANSSQAAISFSYDNVNRVATETLNGKQTSYAYNVAAGKRTIIYPSGRQIERQLDIRNQLSAIRENGGQVIASYEYDIAERNTKRTLGNNTVTNLAYDADSRVTDLNHNPAHFVDFGYGYDKEGNPTSTQFRHQTSHNEQYGYDNEGQLTAFTKGAVNAGTYSYDGVGNRTTAQLSGTPASYTVNNMNAYSGILFGSQITLTYDNNGNLTGDGTTTYSYDRENRLKAVNNGTTAKYSYDALGRRVRKIANNDTINYYFDGLQVIEERSGTDSIKATYVWGRWVDDIVTMYRNGQNYFYHTNVLGSVVAISNAAGAVVERYEYDAFGKAIVYDANFNVLTNGSAIGNPYLYTGREYEKETGLYYYRARYYDPVHGRFLQRDPIGYADGMGIYVYVNNGVFNGIDPLGLTNWRGVTIATIGLIGNSISLVGSVVAGVATSWTGIGGIVGGVIALKSAYGVAANIANLAAAINDEVAPSTGALLPDIAKKIDPCNENLQDAALAADLALDLAGAGNAYRLSQLTREAKLLPLGRGSTGRTIPSDLQEQLTMEEIMSNPNLGSPIEGMPPLRDTRWTGWTKMEYKKNVIDGRITIHYNVEWENGFINAVDDFKFK